MAVHCGGPGGLSLCNYSIWLQLDEEARSTYNIIGFDQRGMGRSEPTFMIPECTGKSAFVLFHHLNSWFQYEDSVAWLLYLNLICLV